jgi:hypothetical protein
MIHTPFCVGRGVLNCSNQTQRDAVRRNHAAWHAGGQGVRVPLAPPILWTYVRLSVSILVTMACAVWSSLSSKTSMTVVRARRSASYLWDDHMPVDGLCDLG